MICECHELGPMLQRTGNWLTCKRSSYACFRSKPFLSVTGGGSGRTSVAIKEMNRMR